MLNQLNELRRELSNTTGEYERAYIEGSIIVLIEIKSLLSQGWTHRKIINLLENLIISLRNDKLTSKQLLGRRDGSLKMAIDLVLFFMKEET